MKLNARKHTVFIGIGVIALLFLSFRMAFTPTLEVWQQNKSLQTAAENKDQVLIQFQQQIERNNALKQQSGATTTNLQTLRRALLQFTDSICLRENLTLIALKPANEYRHNQYEVFLNTIELSGTYQNLLRATNHLEFGFDSGKLVSCKLEKKRNRKTRKNRLHAIITIQTLRTLE